jgi:cytochrome c5
MRGPNTFTGLGLLVAAGGFACLLGGAPFGQSRTDPGGRGGMTMPGQMMGGRMMQRQSANQNSMKQMMKAMMPGILPRGIRPQDLPDPGGAGATLVAKYCAQCHDLPSPAMHSAAEWPAIADRMFRRMSMMGGMGMMGGMRGMMDIEAPSATEQETIVAYLQKHALASIRPGAIPAPGSEGAILFASTCAQCHSLPDPKLHTARQWPGVVVRMQEFMQAMGKPGITTGEKEKIVGYLARHAKR